MLRRVSVPVAILLVAACAGVPPESDVRTLEGVWESHGGFEYSRMDIARSGDIRWLSGGCCDEFQGRSHATFRDAQLVLSPPVEAYVAREVSVCRYIRSGGREYLVPEYEMEFVQEEPEPFGRSFWWGLRHRLPKAVLEERFATCADGEERVSLLDEWADWPIGRQGVRYLARIAREDPSEAVRARAIFALERAGMDGYDNVTDQAVRDAAEAVVRQLVPEEESGGCTAGPAAGGTQASR